MFQLTSCGSRCASSILAAPQAQDRLQYGRRWVSKQTRIDPPSASVQTRCCWWVREEAGVLCESVLYARVRQMISPVDDDVGWPLEATEIPFADCVSAGFNLLPPPAERRFQCRAAPMTEKWRYMRCFRSVIRSGNLCAISCVHHF